MAKELLFSITKKDFKVETMRGSGKGGQNRNKRETCVRITHADSGAIGYSCDERSQAQNKLKAFKRLTESAKFKTWHRQKVLEHTLSRQKIEEKVNEMMRPKNLKVETYDSLKEVWHEVSDM